MSSTGESAGLVASSQRDFLLQRLMEDTQRLHGNGSAAVRNSPVSTNTTAVGHPRQNGGAQRRRKGAPFKNDGTGSSSAEDTDRTDSEENNEEAIVDKPNSKNGGGGGVGGTFQKHRHHHHQRQQEEASPKMFPNGLQMFNNPLHQYAAATLAAQFMQAAAAAGFPTISGHPSAAALLEQYPVLYRSLFPPSIFGNGAGLVQPNNNNNGNGNGSIFTAASSNPASPENGSAMKTASTAPPRSKASTPGATEKRMASISLASPKQTTQTTPSPRKRPPPKVKDSTTKVHSPTAPSSGGGTPKKARAIRRIQFDDEMCSPVSGMYIKDFDDCIFPTVQSPGSQGAEANGDSQLDDTALWVKVTEEAKAELDKIPNLIGDYICRLCKVRYTDAFQLAKHRCPRIAHEEYRCPECDKVFSCPANLASHRRWHKPKDFVVSNNGEQKRQDGDQASTEESSERSPLNSTEDPTEPIDETPIDLSNHHHNGNGNGHHRHQHDEDDPEEEEATNGGQAIVSTPTYHECETCGKRFDAHRWLRAHALAHTNFTNSDENGSADGGNDQPEDMTDGDGESEVQCTESGCRLWFLSADALEKHQRRAHPKFLCKFCSHSFPTSPALTRHINRNHPASVGDCRVILLPQSPPSRA